MDKKTLNPAWGPPRAAERAALEIALDAPGQRIICTTLGRAQAAATLAMERRAASVACWFLDHFQMATAAVAINAIPESLDLLCQSDLPVGPFDLAVLPLSMRGEAELTRELLQQACQRLALGGTLVAAVDNPHDRWLREQLAALFSKATVHPREDAVVYSARKTVEPRKLRDFRAQFAYRDRGRLVHAMSRPGVFSHRRIDPGARQLLAAAEIAPGGRILDIGCGAGTVGLALAAREATASVHAIDSNARAIECTRGGAKVNALANVTAELNSDGVLDQAAVYDLALANPPYYADFRIAAHFLATAHRALRPGGQVIVVAKHPEWYAEHMADVWHAVEHRPSKRYSIITAFRP